MVFSFSLVFSSLIFWGVQILGVLVLVVCAFHLVFFLPFLSFSFFLFLIFLFPPFSFLLFACFASDVDGHFLDCVGNLGGKKSPSGPLLSVFLCLGRLCRSAQIVQ